MQVYTYVYLHLYSCRTQQQCYEKFIHKHPHTHIQHNTRTRKLNYSNRFSHIIFPQKSPIIDGSFAEWDLQICKHIWDTCNRQTGNLHHSNWVSNVCASLMTLSSPLLSFVWLISLMTLCVSHVLPHESRESTLMTLYSLMTLSSPLLSLMWLIALMTLCVSHVLLHESRDSSLSWLCVWVMSLMSLISHDSPTWLISLMTLFLSEVEKKIIGFQMCEWGRWEPKERKNFDDNSVAEYLSIQVYAHTYIHMYIHTRIYVYINK